MGMAKKPKVFAEVTIRGKHPDPREELGRREEPSVVATGDLF